MLRFLMVLTIASVVGLQAWMILFNNFAVDVVRLNGQQVGEFNRSAKSPVSWPCWRST